MTMTTPNSQNLISNILICSLIVLTLIIFVVMLTNSRFTHIKSAAGLDDFDFSTQLAVIRPSAFERFLGKLYTPEGFRAGTVTLETGW